MVCLDGLGFRVWGLGFQDLGGLGFKVWRVLGFRVWGPASDMDTFVAGFEPIVRFRGSRITVVQ